jgi:hypothetical protein
MWWLSLFLEVYSSYFTLSVDVSAASAEFITVSVDVVVSVEVVDVSGDVVSTVLVVTRSGSGRIQLASIV